MDIEYGINCFSPELNGSLGVHHSHPCPVIDCTSHLFSNGIFMVGIWRALFIYGTAGGEDKSDCLIAIFTQVIITPESLKFVPHCLVGPGISGRPTCRSCILYLGRAIRMYTSCCGQ